MNCPRCNLTPLRNYDTLFCLVHGEFYAPTAAWERVAVTDPQPGRRRQRPAVSSMPPWTEEEHELWRRAEAGERIGAEG